MAMMNKRVVVTLGILLVWVAGLCETTQAVEFAGGTGEPNDPYQIATVDQLLAIWSEEGYTKHYVLVASIDLGGTTWSDSVIPVLAGSLDGNGWTIRNFRVDAGGNQGLIGIVSPKAEVRNLGLEGVRIVAGQTCGALASSNLGRLLNCYSTGTITSGHNTGGLVGMNSGTMIDCYSTVDVGGTMGVGGLAGQNTGDITSCHSTGDVTGDNDVGGLVGANLGRIADSYSTGAVTGTTMFVGGLVGINFSVIASSYADSTVLCYDSYVGGLVGQNMGPVMSCYSAGKVTGEEHIGGLAGTNIDSAYIATSYTVASVTVPIYSWWGGGLVGSGSAKDNCYFLTLDDGGGPDNQIGTQLTADQMKQQTSFVDWDFCGTASDGASDEWFMPEGGSPVLAWQTEITGLRKIPDVAGLTREDAQTALTEAGFVSGNVQYDFARGTPAGCVIRTEPDGLAATGTTVDLIVSSDESYAWADNPGNGTTQNPYQISTPGQLDALAADSTLWSRCFVLSADLDMTGRTYETALIAPDTSDSTYGFQGTPFRGTFDGQGHAIRNLTIARIDTRHEYVGLFGKIAESGRVSNLAVLDADVEGGSGSNSLVGILAGCNAGTISDCSATGILRGGKGDGLVGENIGTIADCSVDIVRR